MLEKLVSFQQRHRLGWNIFFLAIGAIIGQSLRKEPHWKEIPIIVIFCAIPMYATAYVVERIVRRKKRGKDLT